MRAVSWVLFTIAITTTTTATNAWIAIGNYHRAENPGKCTINDTMALEPGESMMSSESCMEVYCADDLGNVSVFSCSDDIAVPGCTWGERINSSAAYPDCCRRELDCENPDISSEEESSTYTIDVLEFVEFNGDNGSEED